MTNFQTAKTENGSVIFNGVEYALTTQADETSRLMPYAPYHEAKDGEEYAFEMAAYAIDADDNEYRVTWEFMNIKGKDGRQLDEFDYDDAHSVEPV